MGKVVVSIVMPCLNEEKSIGKSIQWAKQGIRKLKLPGEIIVVDNGSIDSSPTLAKKAGAIVVSEINRGYGKAYLTGIARAKGNIFILGDSDGTYDFRTLYPFIKRIEEGADLVLGSRLRGTIKRGAMAFSHRYIGTPILTTMLNISYGSQISDAHTGMRALTRNAFLKMNLRSTGMEFASEMIVKAIYHKMQISEVPIPYYRRTGISKLSPISDSWRHIKFMILYAPTYALVLPGFILLLLGGVASLVLVSGGRYIMGWFFDIHTMTIGILLANLGVQLILLGLFAKVFTEKSLQLPSGPLASYLITKISVERLLILGIGLFIVSLAIISFVTYSWIASNFGPLSATREILFAVGIGSIGAQCMFASFLYGLIKES